MAGCDGQPSFSMSHGEVRQVCIFERYTDYLPSHILSSTSCPGRDKSLFRWQVTREADAGDTAAASRSFVRQSEIRNFPHESHHAISKRKKAYDRRMLS